MRINVGEGLRVFPRVIEFVLTIVVKPTIGAITIHVETLTGVVGRLTEYVVLQDESDRACRSLSRDARLQALTLWQEYVLPIARLGRTLFGADEGSRQSLAVPRATTYQGMIAGALALAGRAKEHRQLLVNAGCDPDFIERLIAAALGLKATLDAKEMHAHRRAGATAGAIEELRRGREIVRLLNTLLRPQLRKSPVMFAEWRRVSRFVPVRPAEVVEPVPVPVPGAATTPAATDHAA
jgi:hypothetical protein